MVWSRFCPPTAPVFQFCTGEAAITHHIISEPRWDGCDGSCLSDCLPPLRGSICFGKPTCFGLCSLAALAVTGNQWPASKIDQSDRLLHFPTRRQGVSISWCSLAKDELLVLKLRASSWGLWQNRPAGNHGITLSTGAEGDAHLPQSERGQETASGHSREGSQSASPPECSPGTKYHILLKVAPRSSWCFRGPSSRDCRLLKLSSGCPPVSRQHRSRPVLWTRFLSATSLHLLYPDVSPPSCAGIWDPAGSALRIS